ncbi:MAG: 30S ribosomal protein S6 [Bacteroidetes bacterium]|nr:30S ribosomal protein S6 [Bacteroidota bacterium]
MRRYETIYILRPTLGEEEITTIVDNTNTIIADDGGVIIDTDKWGMRKLAYPIEKEAQGFYVYCDYAGTPAAVSEVERKFRIDDSVLRYMTIKTSEVITQEDIEKASGDAVARKEAAQEDAETEVAKEEKPATNVTPKSDAVSSEKKVDAASEKKDDAASGKSEVEAPE